MLTLSTLLIILYCLTTSHAINRRGQFGGYASAFLRNDEDWVCVWRRNIGRKPEQKLNFKEKRHQEAEHWKNATKWEKSYKKKVLIRQMSRQLLPEGKYHLLPERQKYGEFTDTSKWKESSYWQFPKKLGSPAMATTERVLVYETWQHLTKLKHTHCSSVLCTKWERKAHHKVDRAQVIHSVTVLPFDSDCVLRLSHFHSGHCLLNSNWGPESTTLSTQYSYLLNK